MKRTVLMALMVGFVMASSLQGENLSASLHTNIETENIAYEDYSPLTEKDIYELKNLLQEIQLNPSDLNFEKDWDLSTWGKSEDFMHA